MGLIDKFKNAWNAFSTNKDIPYNTYSAGYSSSFRPDKVRYSRGNERSVVTAVYTRMAIDISAIKIKHVMLDDNDRFVKEMKSGLNECLTVEANKDQQSRLFIQDIVMSLFDEGSVAVVPIDTYINLNKHSFDILSMRTAKILQWYPDHIQVEVYNDRSGVKENLIFNKKDVAIIENPYYSVMNEHNSVSQRLIRKLNLLDTIDEQSGSGKLDLIIQLPYTIKSEARQINADKRKKSIEDQLENSKYGIVYTDGMEKITQLNRSVENNLLKQIEYLTSMLYSQLGVNEKILNGSADETVMLNYTNATLEPVLSAITSEFNRKFLKKQDRNKGESIKYFNDPFKLVTVINLAEIVDKFTRNEIMTSNEIRQIIGMKPIKDPEADVLRNKNLNSQSGSNSIPTEVKEDTETNDKEGENQNG